MTPPARQEAVSTNGEWEIETMLEIIGGLLVSRRQGCRQRRVVAFRRVEDAFKNN
jgi:hypothetical protein